MKFSLTFGQLFRFLSLSVAHLRAVHAGAMTELLSVVVKVLFQWMFLFSRSCSTLSQSADENQELISLLVNVPSEWVVVFGSQTNIEKTGFFYIRLVFYHDVVQSPM